MSYCIPSSPQPYYCAISIGKLVFIRRSWRSPRNQPLRKIHTPSCSTLSLFSNSDSKPIVRNGKLRFTASGFEAYGGVANATNPNICAQFSRCTGTVGSEDYEFTTELGFKEKEERNRGFQTSQHDALKEAGGADFLEVKGKKRGKSEGSLKERDDLVPIEEGSKSVVSKTDGRRQVVMRRTSMLAKQVISLQSALSLGFVSQLWVDACSWTVLVVEVRPNLLSGESERFLLDDVNKVGDVVLIHDENVLGYEFEMVGLETLVGYNVVTQGLQSIGKVRGYNFNVNSGAVQALELDSFGISIIPSSLVSTYSLLVEDVLEVVSDTIVVHEGAASRLQRLTKGFWNTRSMVFPDDELEGYSKPDRQSAQSNRPRQRSREHRPTMRDVEDDWEFPMDYF